MGLERGPLRLVNTIEELLGRSSSSGLDNQDYGCEDSFRSPRNTLYPQTLAVSPPTSSGHSVGIVLSRTQAMEYFLVSCITMALVGNGLST
jgi:hypothetical protein